MGREVIEVLDILLKWFVLRFCESNTSCLLKVNRILLISVIFCQHARVFGCLNLSNDIFEKGMSGSILEPLFIHLVCGIFKITNCY